MKFKFYRLMNETDLDTGSDNGGGSESTDSTEALMDNAGFSDGPSDEDIFKRYGLESSKYELGEEKTTEGGEESQGSDEEKELAGQETDEKTILNLVNSLGAIHGDQPIKIESRDQLKNLVQMGHDYTQKTQALSEERKVLESERGQVEQVLEGSINEFNQRVQAFETQQREFQQWTYTIEALKQDAPDIFDEIQRAFSNTGKQFDNPVYNQKFAALESKLANAEKALAERENKLIVDSFDTEKGKLASTEQSLKELGITVDWDAAKKEWASTGLPLNKVVGSLYFDAMTKAQASKSKVATVKTKVAAKPTGMANASRPGMKSKAIDPKLSDLKFATALWDRYKQ